MGSRGLVTRWRASSTAGESAGPGSGGRLSSGDADTLADVVTSLTREIGIANGIGAVGYGEDDIDDLVDGTLNQQLQLAACLRAVEPEVLARIFARSLEL